MSSALWHNSGGDRTWIAPELDFFCARYNDLSTHSVPRPLDPGDYRLVKEPGQTFCRNDFVLRSSRLGSEVALRITKSVYPAENPCGDDSHLGSSVEYAGYTLHTILQRREASEAAVGLWNLLSLPYGGKLLAATHGPCRPTDYFGTVDPSQIVSLDHRVSWQTTGKGIQKIGLKAVDLTGRVGYLYPQGRRWSLVVRDFFVDPAGQYIDVPSSDTTDLGYAVQGCCVDTAELGQFVEVECHSPAIEPGQCDRSEDWARVWAFRGGLADVEEIARRLLRPAPMI